MLYRNSRWSHLNELQSGADGSCTCTPDRNPPHLVHTRIKVNGLRALRPSAEVSKDPFMPGATGEPQDGSSSMLVLS